MNWLEGAPIEAHFVRVAEKFDGALEPPKW